MNNVRCTRRNLVGALATMAVGAMVLCSSMAHAGNWGSERIRGIRSGGDIDIVQAKQVAKLLAEGDKQAGLPNIKNYQEKKLMKTIMEARDQENLLTWVYLKSDYSGKLLFIGNAIGYGVPFSAQYTNPMKIIDVELTGGFVRKQGDNGEMQVLPQADPNGLFMPTSSSATWLLMIDQDVMGGKGKGKARSVYLEPEIVVSPFAFRIGVSNVNDYPVL